MLSRTPHLPWVGNSMDCASATGRVGEVQSISLASHSWGGGVRLCIFSAGSELMGAGLRACFVPTLMSMSPARAMRVVCHVCRPSLAGASAHRSRLVHRAASGTSRSSHRECPALSLRHVELQHGGCFPRQGRRGERKRRGFSGFVFGLARGSGHEREGALHCVAAVCALRGARHELAVLRVGQRACVPCL